MENLKKLLQFLGPLPVWLRVIVASLVVAAISLCLLLSSVACGVTQTVVNNNDSEGNSISMSVNPSQQTSSTINPQIDLQP